MHEPNSDLNRSRSGAGPLIIQHVAWHCHRFNLSHRDIEDVLAERGIEVSYESARRWCTNFGPLFSKLPKREQPEFGDTFFIEDRVIA